MTAGRPSFLWPLARGPVFLQSVASAWQAPLVAEPTRRKVPFSREQTLAAAVFADGDQLLTTTPLEQPSPLYCIIEGLTEA